MWEEEGTRPKILDSEPELNDVEDLYFRGFLTLNATRTEGFSGPQRLMLRDVMTMAELLELPEEEQMLFLQSMIRMDSIMLEHHRLQSKRQK